MPIYQPKELHAFLNAIDAFPKKRLSQNFLVDGNIVRKILVEAQVSKDDTVLEIGPGPGALTEALIETGARVIAVEKDSLFARHLARFQPSSDEQLHVICNDILQVDLPSLDRKIKIIGNLPYHITTPILSKFLSKDGSRIESLTFMVQDEVAKRVVARPKTEDYSSLTVFLNFYAEVKYAFKVSKSCFYPIPGVDSAIISLKPKPIPSHIAVDAFFEMTRRAFQMRRKTLKKSLRELYSEEVLLTALEATGLTLFTRPEELSVEQFLLFFHHLQKNYCL
ncbi:Ribosomal RNA small subunit methyltransferase A [Chlamydiales bacterium STE3]|nr:Ribosomal RNA small subunit methyltransferase A [Chlamydiales bacterium STE3]